MGRPTCNCAPTVDTSICANISATDHSSNISSGFMSSPPVVKQRYRDDYPDLMNTHALIVDMTLQHGFEIGVAPETQRIGARRIESRSPGRYDTLDDGVGNESNALRHRLARHA